MSATYSLVVSNLLVCVCVIVLSKSRDETYDLQQSAVVLIFLAVWEYLSICPRAIRSGNCYARSPNDFVGLPISSMKALLKKTKNTRTIPQITKGQKKYWEQNKQIHVGSEVAGSFLCGWGYALLKSSNHSRAHFVCSIDRGLVSHFIGCLFIVNRLRGLSYCVLLYWLWLKMKSSLIMQLLKDRNWH